MCRRQILRLALFAVALATALVAGACAKKKVTTLYLPAEGTSIAITLKFPVDAVTGDNQSFATTCEGTKSILVSLDVDSADTIGWDYRFLFAPDGTLWGCEPTTPCPDATIHQSMKRPHRVAVEGIDVAPADYSAATTHNVVCRGVADERVAMGTIGVTYYPTPSPASTPQAPALDMKVDVEIPVLRLGDVNWTFSAAGARGSDSSAALLGPAGANVARTTSGGIVLEFDPHPVGTAAPSVLAFDPRTIETRALGFSLPESRYNASVVGVLDSAGSPAVLIAGGTGQEGTPPIDSVELVWRNGAGPEFTNSSFFRLAAMNYVADHQEGASLAPAVVLLGGVVDNAGSYALNDRYEFFFPAAPTDTSSCLPGAVTGSPAICVPGSGIAMGDGGHFAFPTGSAGAAGLLIGPGYQQAGTAYAESAHSYIFNPETKTYGSPIGFAGTPPPILSSKAAVQLSSNIVASFSSLAIGGQATNAWEFLRADGSAFVEGARTLVVGRKGAVQVPLRDGRVLIAGGGTVPGIDYRAVEVYTPIGGVATDGNFSLLARGSASCTSSTSAACVRLGVERAFATGVRLDGTRTWLNGAVVIVGGATQAGLDSTATELYVPAYECNGATPVVAGTVTPVSGVDFCDRNRTRRELTSPSSPSRVPE